MVQRRAARPPRPSARAAEAERQSRREEDVHADAASSLRTARPAASADVGAARRPARQRRRSALAVTRIDEPDRASAATSGVTWPAMASGTVGAQVLAQEDDVGGSAEIGGGGRRDRHVGGAPGRR